MDPSIINLILMLGGISACFAAAMSFLITYNEYTHHYPDKKTPVKNALQSAAVTFFIFILLTLGIIFFISKQIAN